MNKILRYSLVSLLAIMTTATYATIKKVTIDFDSDYQTIFPTITGVSSSDSNAGDFTEATYSAEIEGITLLVTPQEGAKNPNRIWNTSPRLRLYAGYFAVMSTGGDVIKKIEFNAPSKFDLTEYSVTPTAIVDKVWKPEGAGSMGGIFAVNSNTQLKSIVVTLGAAEDVLEDEGGEGGEGGDTYTLVGDGTLEKPFTAKDAIYLANKGEHASDKVYITGKVFKVNTKDENITKYGNIDYFISEDGQEADPSFEIYRGKYFEDASFTVDNKVKVGDEVVVYGSLAMYNTQAETAAGAVLIKLNGSTTGINIAKMDKQNGVIYNVAGQKVTSSYKGLVIMNGKKFVNK